MSHTLHLPTAQMPLTAALLRGVFGTHPVPVQRVPATRTPGAAQATHMEAALLGLEYVKLLIAGTQKLPVLTLVDAEGGLADVFLRWLQDLVQVPVRKSLLREQGGTTDAHGVVLWRGAPDDELQRLLQALQATHEVCFHPNDAARHRHVSFFPALCLVCAEPPDPSLFRTLHWVRCLPPYALEGMDERTFWQLLTLEFTAVMQLFPKPFLTRPTTALWFSAEQLLEPYPTDQAA